MKILELKRQSRICDLKNLREINENFTMGIHCKKRDI
jgi:hypothetical protein